MADGAPHGMDPWQQSVETRLSELRADTRAILTDISTLRGELAGLKERVGSLPTKGFIVNSVLSTLAVIAALILFADQLKVFFHLR